MKELLECNAGIKVSELTILTVSQCRGDVFQSHLSSHLKTQNHLVQWSSNVVSSKCFFGAQNTGVLAPTIHLKSLN